MRDLKKKKQDHGENVKQDHREHPQMTFFSLTNEYNRKGQTQYNR